MPSEMESLVELRFVDDSHEPQTDSTSAPPPEVATEEVRRIVDLSVDSTPYGDEEDVESDDSLVPRHIGRKPDPIFD